MEHKNDWCDFRIEAPLLLPEKCAPQKVVLAEVFWRFTNLTQTPAFVLLDRAFPPHSSGAPRALRHSTSHITSLSFSGGTDGAYTLAGLVRDKEGNLYGTTVVGGDLTCGRGFFGPGCGTVFKLDISGNETVLYSFKDTPDGALPFAGLLKDKAGNLYGTTFNGGAYGYGTVFKLVP